MQILGAGVNGVQLPISYTTSTTQYLPVTKNTALIRIHITGTAFANSGGASQLGFRIVSGPLPLKTLLNVSFHTVALEGVCNSKLIRFGQLNYNAIGSGQTMSPNVIALYADRNITTHALQPITCADFASKIFTLTGSFFISSSVTF